MTKNQLDKAMRLMKDDSAESNSKAYAMIAKSPAEIKTEGGIERAIRIFLKDS